MNKNCPKSNVPTSRQTSAMKIRLSSTKTLPRWRFKREGFLELWRRINPQKWIRRDGLVERERLEDGVERIPGKTHLHRGRDAVVENGGNGHVARGQARSDRLGSGRWLPVNDHILDCGRERRRRRRCVGIVSSICRVAGAVVHGCQQVVVDVKRIPELEYACEHGDQDPCADGELHHHVPTLISPVRSMSPRHFTSLT